MSWIYDEDQQAKPWQSLGYIIATGALTLTNILDILSDTIILTSVLGEKTRIHPGNQKKGHISRCAQQTYYSKVSQSIY